MISKRAAAVIITVSLIRGLQYPVAALNIPGSVSFSASVSLTSEFEKPSAKIHYTVRGTAIPESSRNFSFYDPMMELFFGTDISPATFNPQTLFQDGPYFPNDILITLNLEGEDPYRDVRKTLSGEVVIPRVSVSEPGIEYFITAEDSREQSWYVGTTGFTPQVSRVAVPVSNSIVKTITPSGGKIVFPDTNSRDGDVHLKVPAGAVSGDLEVTIEMQEADTASFARVNAGEEPVLTYVISAAQKILDKEIEVQLLYYDTDMNPGLVDGTSVNENDLAVFWHDGFEWRSLGGIIDPEQNTITVSMNRFTRLAIFKRAPSAAGQYRPKEKIITPHLRDTINDVAQFDNLGGRTDVSISIYDITGRKIRTVHSPYVWDGRDDDGDLVETGVYIYQFEVDGTRVSGTIAVAK